MRISFRILGDEKTTAMVEGGALEKLDPVMSELQHLNVILRTSRDEHAFFMDREVEHRNRRLRVQVLPCIYFLHKPALSVVI